MTQPLSEDQKPSLKATINERSIGGPEGLGHDPVRVPFEALKEFTAGFLRKLEIPPDEARRGAEILVTSDLRAIESHGVPRLDMYLGMYRNKYFNPCASFRIERETGATALVDGNGGLGLVVGPKAMDLAIKKAAATGIGLVAVKNSSHFGIAGYYAEMALAHDMIGLAMTNAAPLMLPTGGKEARLGTNPLAFGAPAKNEFPFLLDMATSAVAMGKFEIAARLEKSIPEGWGMSESGQPTSDPLVVLTDRKLAPLGSFAELSSHKGYGLGVMVDILTGVLSGMGHSMKLQRLRAGHFFGAIKIEAFRDTEEFKLEMDEMIRDLRNTPPAEGSSRVFVAGEKEYIAQEENLRLGVPLHPKVAYRLKQIGEELGIPWNMDAS